MQTYKVTKSLVKKTTLDKFFEDIPNPEKYKVEINHKNTDQWIIETNLLLSDADKQRLQALRD